MRVVRVCVRGEGSPVYIYIYSDTSLVNVINAQQELPIEGHHLLPPDQYIYILTRYPKMHLVMQNAAGALRAVCVIIVASQVIRANGSIWSYIIGQPAVEGAYDGPTDADMASHLDGMSRRSRIAPWDIWDGNDTTMRKVGCFSSHIYIYIYICIYMHL